MKLSRLSALMATAGSALTLGMATPAGAQPPAPAAAASGWRVVFSHHYGAIGNSSEYATVTAPSPTSAWAFGAAHAAGASLSNIPAAARWNGRQWSAAPLPAGLKGFIFAAGASSPRDVWAAITGDGDILHWNGSRWTVAKRTKTEGHFTDLLALSARDVWLFGGPGADGGAGAWHFDGKTWTHATGLTNDIETASALSHRDIWAVGSSGKEPADAVVHFTGTTWRPVTAPALRGRQFGGVLALSPNDVWVAAESATNNTRQHFVHFNGRTWRAVSPPWAGLLLGFFPTPDGHGGFWDTASTTTGAEWLIHHSAAGRWSRVRSPEGLPDTLTAVRGTRALLGAGGIITPDGETAAVWQDGRIG